MQKIQVNGRTICAKKIFTNEYAWKITDVPAVVKHMEENRFVILGGDVLTCSLEHNYDNWYYNANSQSNWDDNVVQSAAIANEYITNYQKQKGDSFWIVLVTKEEKTD